jgi:hypothetical protein
MSPLSSAARRRESRALPPVPPAKPMERRASNGQSPTGDKSRGAAEQSSGASGESRNAAQALKQAQRNELGRIVSRASEVGALLSELGPDDVDRALAVIFAARDQLEETERQLVRLALQAGLSWARIGAALGICTGGATQERLRGSE